MEIAPALVSVVSNERSESLVFEKEIAQGATVGDLLAALAFDLAPRYKSFYDAVFNPETREVSEQVLVILNDNLLQHPHLMDARLGDGDRLMLAIVFGGG